MLNIKICSIQYPERYVLRRMVIAAQQELLPRFPDLELDITELSDPGLIGKYAFVLVLPTLVINEKVVCSGRFPSKDEVTGWLVEAVQK
ncbi:MAG: thioredoxin family protein [Anaerolineales bacterium]|nr:thioredoxin family protein [Anaerolineales bacterium]